MFRKLLACAFAVVVSAVNTTQPSGGGASTDTIFVSSSAMTAPSSSALPQFPPTWKCGSYGVNLDCGSHFAVGLCHSGTNPECGFSANCPSGTYAAVQCSNQTARDGYHNWLYGSYGAHLSCASTTGMAATGACGGGMNPDCSGHTYFGIDCSDNGVKVGPNSCQWTYHKWGEYVSCPADRPILAGSCSGGANPDCNGHYFATQCCTEKSTVIEVLGQWEKGPYSSGTQAVSYSLGTTTSDTESQTATLGSIITASVEVGCEILGAGGKTTLSSSLSSSLARTDSHSFSMTETSGYSTTLPAGRIWQWVWDVTLNRGTAHTKGRALVSTNGDWLAPCCVPGDFEVATDPLGACHSGPRLCAGATPISLLM